MFFYLETWVGSTSTPYTTAYLAQLRAFQKQITTAAFKVAGGVDLSSAAASSSRPAKQHPIAQEFVTKITKAFTDALYAFLDGLVHLAEDDAAATRPVLLPPPSSAIPGNNPLELVKVDNPVSVALVGAVPSDPC